MEAIAVSGWRERMLAVHGIGAERITQSWAGHLSVVYRTLQIRAIAGSC
jgi:hypothetical protein